MKLEVVRKEEQDPKAMILDLQRKGWSLMGWKDQPGTQYPPHQHDHDEVIGILEGTIAFEIAGQSHTLYPGDRLTLPAGTVHSAIVPIDQGVHFVIGSRPPAQPPG